MSLIILFISGLLWGIFDLTRKLSLEILSLANVIYLIFFSQLIVFAISLCISDLTITSYYYFPILVLISLLNILSLYCFLKAIKISEISMSIPLLSYSPLFSLLFAKIILNEHLTIYQHFGIIIILFGSFVLYSKSLKFKDLLGAPFSLLNNKGAQLIIIVTLIWSIVPVLDKKSFSYTDIYLHGFLQSLLGILFLLLILRVPRNIKSANLNNRRDIVILLLLIIVSFLATITQFFALKVNLVPILEVFKRATGILLSLFFGYFFFKEHINKQKVVSVFIILAGLSLII